jgi:hypothetical protein
VRCAHALLTYSGLHAMSPPRPTQAVETHLACRRSLVEVRSVSQAEARRFAPAAVHVCSEPDAPLWRPRLMWLLIVFDAAAVVALLLRCFLPAALCALLVGRG